MNIDIGCVSNNFSFMMAWKPKRLSDKALIKHVYQGMPKAEILKQYSISQTYLDERLLKLSLPIGVKDLKKLYLEKRIRELADQGKSVGEISKEIKINEGTCYKYIRIFNTEDNPIFSGKTQIGMILRRQDEIKELMAQGKSIKEIANYYNVKIGTIYKVLNKLDISTQHMETIHSLKRSQILQYLYEYEFPRKVAKQLGISARTLRKYMSSFNITKQTVGGINIWH